MIANFAASTAGADLALLLAQQAPVPARAGGMSFFDLIQAGGLIGYIIMFLSFIAVALIVVHVVRIRESALAPQIVIDDLDRLLSKGEVDKALAACELPENACFLSRVMGAGLSRYRRSPFGALELKGSLEEAGQEQIARLYRSTDALALIAGIAPMLGLLGTVVGLNGAFATISATEGFARPDQLAGDVSLALVTTIQGLVVAIPLTAVVAYFRNRIDGLAADVAAIVDDLASHLESGATGVGARDGAGRARGEGA
jgi:biopolymer transport protein ExbB